MSRRLIISLALLALAIGVLAPVAAAQTPDRTANRELPQSVADLKLSTPRTARVSQADLDNALLGGGDRVEVIITLETPSIAEQGAEGAEARGAKREIEQEQAELVERIDDAADADVITETQVVLNAVVAEVDADAIPEIVEDPAVLKVNPVGLYQMDLTETVPYIGADAVHDLGFDGSGIRVAVLDSGIDYTHAALGGSGDPDDYVNNDPDVIEPSTFPTTKVVGGFDFVGSTWTGDPGSPDEKPDPDPLDDGPNAGHGTHVADIIGGLLGVAPGVDLYAVKVCSSVSNSCSGTALIQGMEFATDPNGDGDPSDHVDIINMSLGAPYGQPFDDDLSAAVDNATEVGILTVASAGNGADKPFVSGSPAAAATALSVAQTHVPSAGLQLIGVNSSEVPAVFQPWSVPLADSQVITGDLQYGDGSGGNLNGCAPFTTDLSGLIVLVDRGACNFSLKISNISVAGGSAGIIGLVAPGAPFPGGDGGDRPIDIPGYMISQSDSSLIKASIPSTGTIDENSELPLVGSVVGSSSRGPQTFDHRIKPEIGAPGASVSAIAGTGAGTGAFGGTSGAAPMVSGSAALVMEAHPDRSPMMVKAVLMNTGDTDIDNDAFSGLAPISRIGGGEIRVDAAVNSPTTALDRNDRSAAGLNFGYVEAWPREQITLIKQVRVFNHTDRTQRYTITPTFRYPNDEATRAVQVSAPGRVTVRANSGRTFDVTMTIRAELLPDSHMNSGSAGADPSTLTLNEYDGYLLFDNGHGSYIHMPWHVLPRKSSFMRIDSDHDRLFFVDGVAVTPIRNRGVGTAQNDAYALIATSEDIPRGGRGEQSPTPDIRAVGVNTFPVPAGFCSAQDSFIWAFAINTHEPQTHVLPVSHQVILDTDQDGNDDYVVLNRDVSFSGASDGRQLTWAFDLSNNTASAFFFAEHATNTGNTVLYICGEQIGLTGTNILATNVNAAVFAQDFYFGGPGDLVTGLTITPLGERFFAIPEDLPSRTSGEMITFDFGLFPGNSPELGILLVTNGDRGAGARGGNVPETEALLALEADDKHWDHVGGRPGDNDD